MNYFITSMVLSWCFLWFWSFLSGLVFFFEAWKLQSPFIVTAWKVTIFRNPPCAFHGRTTVIRLWNDMRVSKWCLNVHFLVELSCNDCVCFPTALCLWLFYYSGYSCLLWSPHSSPLSALEHGRCTSPPLNHFLSHPLTVVSSSHLYLSLSLFISVCQ